MFIENTEDLFIVRYYEPQYEEDISADECPDGLCKLSEADLAALDDEDGEF